MLSGISADMSRKIQITRGVSIIMVVLIHTILWNPYEIYIRPLLNPAVAVFIFLSGVLTDAESVREGVGRFYKKRLLRVLIPYTIWSAVYVIYTGDYKDAIIDYLTGQCCSIYYYILVYMQLVLVTPLLIILMNCRGRWIGYIITSVAIIVEYILALRGVVIPYPYNINNLFVWVSFYYLGLSMRAGHVPMRKYNRKVYIVGAGAAIILYGIEIAEALCWRGLGRMDIATSQLKLSTEATSIVVCILLYVLLTDDNVSMFRDRWIGRVLSYIGGCSFAIYLTHQLVILVWNEHFPDLRLSTDWWFIIEAIIVLAICTALITCIRKISRGRLGRWLGLY